MKITHVLPALTKGGAERVVVNLANHAVEAGHEVTVLAAHQVDESWMRKDLGPQIRVRYIDRNASRIGRYLGLWSWLRRNRDWLLGQDVIHCHLSFGTIFGAAMQRLRGRRARPAIVETYHAVGMRIPRFNRWLHGRLCRQRDALALMARDPYWERLMARRKALVSAVIPNGIPIPPAASGGRDVGFRRSTSVRQATWLVGSIGRLVPARKPWLVIEAFGLIAKSLGDRVHFYLGGDGPEAARVSKDVRDAGIESAVTLPGLVEDPAIPLSSTDLYLTLNVGAITGVSGMEAVAAGVPVLAIQLLDDHEGRNDWIWSSADLPSLAAKAELLLKDDEARRRLAADQLAYLRAHHSVEAMAQAYYELYEQALARLDPGPAAITDMKGSVDAA